MPENDLDLGTVIYENLVFVPLTRIQISFIYMIIK